MAAKRELIDTGNDKRYVRRDKKGQFKESDDVGRSLGAPVRTRISSAPGANGQARRLPTEGPRPRRL
jgi:hypothetical protein